MLERKLNISHTDRDSLFLWGARQTGKSTYLKTVFKDARYYDLLLPNTYARLKRNPELLIEELALVKDDETVIIDEIQLLPELLNAVHWMLTHRDLRFILCGSSARKLRRIGANMLGGRALREQMYPLVSAEIPDFNLIHAINNGMIPRHYLVENAANRLEGYVGNYLKEEIEAEAITRNLSSFARFLEVAAQTDGEMVNYNNLAADCGVSAKSVKEYFNILQDTLIGYMVPAYQKVIQRRLIKAPKFYFFDIGIVNHLCHRQSLRPGSADFGHAFEHFIIQELTAYLGYTHSRHILSYWRTASGYEVDAVLGDAQVAIEVKSTDEVQSRHIKGLKAFSEEHPAARLIIVSLDTNKRLTSGVEVWPVLDFLHALWSGEIISESSSITHKE